MQNKTMTIQEVSETLGVTPEAIRKHIRDLYPDLMSHGKVTYLTQADVARIKERMQQSTKVVSSKTEIEIMEGGLAYIQWLQSKIEEQKTQLTEAQPKIEFFDVVTGQDSKSHGMSQTVKLLNLSMGRNNFYKLLKSDKILKDDKEPYQQYLDSDYFRLILKQVAHGRAEKVVLVTGKGLAWLQKKYAYLTKENL